MANEINFGYLTGRTLVAFVYQEDGTERDFGADDAGISLTEVAGAALYDGLYLGDCATIAAGDLVMITEGGVSVGQGQYKPDVTSSAAEADIAALEAKVDIIDTNVDTLITNGGIVHNVYNETYDSPPPLVVINV